MSLDEAELRRHEVWERVDRVPGSPEMTDFKRELRLRQAQWRAEKKFPIGTEPIRPKDGKPSRQLGSRLDFDFADQSRANFLSDDIRSAVKERIERREPYETLKHDRLLCDLLSSMPMCFNLFGALRSGGNDAGAAKFVKFAWPKSTGTVSALRFEWSPCRSRPGQYLENRSAFDAAFDLLRSDGRHEVLGIETKYHEHAKPEKRPTSKREARYRSVAEKSQVFKPNAAEQILGTPLQQVWQDHLLLLSMLQHPSRKWMGGKFILVYPEANKSFTELAREYSQTLDRNETFAHMSIEAILAADVLSESLSQAFRERYL